LSTIRAKNDLNVVTNRAELAVSMNKTYSQVNNLVWDLNGNGLITMDKKEGLKVTDKGVKLADATNTFIEVFDSLQSQEPPKPNEP
jgi:Mn-dependent DtxR family transcriptional regulator